MWSRSTSDQSPTRGYGHRLQLQIQPSAPPAEQISHLPVSFYLLWPDKPAERSAAVPRRPPPTTNLHCHRDVVCRLRRIAELPASYPLLAQPGSHIPVRPPCRNKPSPPRDRPGCSAPAQIAEYLYATAKDLFQSGSCFSPA